MFKPTLLTTLAFVALSAFAQDTPPTPLTKTEKTAIGTQLQRRQALLQQIESIQKQLQEIDGTTSEIIGEAYGARKIEQKDWVIKSDLTGWMKPATPAPAPAEEAKAAVKK